LDKALADTTQMVGFLDKDMDGKLSWQELPGSIKKRLVQGFKMVDTNADGGLDIQELYSLSKRGQQAQSNDASTEAGGG
jgi:Ca2+-binding EF-hand superfamily protein